MPKQIVYLLGSGATQGVVKHAENQSLLTTDIQEYIRNELKGSADAFSDKIWNEIVSDDRDVEHLITVLDCQHKYETAIQVRRLYQEAIVNLAGKLKEPLRNNLYTYLVDLHVRSPKLLEREELSCFLSLNYEDLLERSIINHVPEIDVDYGLEIDKTAEFERKVTVLKLHGSFNWVNTRPIQLGTMGNVPPDLTLWIPPGVDKKRENYPFNLLWGKAVEFIQAADVIRVIGCSLSRNDWGLIPILYTTQSLSSKAGVTIELIDYVEPIKGILGNYKYLRCVQFVDLPEVKQFKPRGTTLSREDLERHYSLANKNAVNVFEDWLRAKIELLYTEDDVMREDLLNKDPAALASNVYTNSR